jgi:hypothetical protein
MILVFHDLSVVCPQSPASQPQDYAEENLICTGVTVLFLVFPGILLFEALHSRRKTQDAARGKQVREESTAQ